MHTVKAHHFGLGLGLGLGLAILPFLPTLHANQIVLPGSIGVASTGRDHDLTAAFNSVDRTWLLVWRETDAGSPSATVVARVVREDRTFASSAVVLGGGADVTAPRAAHDPIRNEWLVVFRNSFAFDTSIISISARKVSASGAVVGSASRSISPGNTGELFPDVMAGRFESRVQINPPPPSPFFLAVWQQTISGQPAIVARRLFDDATQDSRIGFDSAQPAFFRVDVGPELPVNRASTRPRISASGPIGQSSGPLSALRRETHPRVVFEVESAGERDVYMADVNGLAVFGALKISPAQTAEDAPEVAWNPLTGRTLVAFRRPGVGIRGQLVEPAASAPFHALLGGEIAVSAGDQASIAAQAGTEIFYASAHNAGNFGLGCIAGLRVVGTPAAGAANGDSLSLSPSSAGNVLLAFRRPNGTGGTIVRASILTTPPPAITNSAPVARAGADVSVVEGTLLLLDGSASSDANGDPLRFQWSRTGAGSPGDFFVDAGQRTRPAAQLLAPLLDASATSVTLTFELQVDDFRSFPAFPAADSVAVTVLPATDARPPTARAGADRDADEEASVTLDGTASSDPDGDPLSFGWTLEAVAPPLVPPASVAIAGGNSARPTFTTPRFANPGGIDLIFQLTVTTPRGGRSDDTVAVHVRDTISESPLANAGPDLTGAQAVSEGTPFSLDGTASSDPNGDPLTFHWELASGLAFNGNLRETIEITGEDTATPSITTSVFSERGQIFRLTVTDPSGLTSTDDVFVTVREVPLQVLSFAPSGGSPGTRVTIRGINFASPDTRVFFGAEDITHTGLIDQLSDTTIVVRVPGGGPSRFRTFVGARHLRGVLLLDHHDIRSAPITVRKGTARATFAQAFEVPHLEITEAYLTQGLESYPMVQGKWTSVHVRVRTSLGGPQSPLPELTSATCNVIPSSGAPFQAVLGAMPSKALAATAQPTQIGDAVNFHLDPSQTLASSYRISVQIFNNGVEVASLRTEQESTTFSPTVAPRILAIHVVPFENGGVAPTWTAADQAAHQRRADAAFTAFARIYPFSSMASQAKVVYLPNPLALPNLIGSDGKVHLQQFGVDAGFDALLDQVGAINELNDTLDAYNAAHPQARAQFVVAMIASELYGDGATGLAVPPRGMMADAIRFTILQNVGAASDLLERVLGFIEDITCVLSLGFACADPVDILLDIVLDALEDAGLDVTGKTSFVIVDDAAGDTLAQELGHNLGFVNPFDRGHDPGNVSHSLYDEDVGLTFHSAPMTDGPVINPVLAESALFHLQNPGRRPAKSVMAYAPSKTNANSFLEPEQYRRIFDTFRSGQGAGAEDGSPAGRDSPAMRISGVYSFHEDELRIREARPALPTELLTPTEPESAFQLAFLDAAGRVLDVQGFGFNVQVPFHTHGDDGEDGEEPEAAAVFRLVHTIPAGTARAEIRLEGRTLWSRSALGSAPTLELRAPLGGEDVPPEAELVVHWLSVDVDGDEITHSVLYSADGGATYTPIAVAMRGNELRWATSAAAASDTAVVKVVAHDGFHATEVVSGQFRLGGGRPSVSILAPAMDARLVSSRAIAFSGLARAAGGGPVTDPTSFSWFSSVVGVLGMGHDLVAGPLAAGTHRIRLDVTLGVETVSAEIEITVHSDRDGDGVDDETEAAAGLDPDDGDDVNRDEDEDGLATGAEVLDLGSDPRDPDSDDDGIGDSEEARQGTEPTSADTDGDGARDPDDNCPLGSNPDQADADADGRGDVCDPEPEPTAPVFRRGDPNGDGRVDISDAVSLLTHLFLGGAAPICEDAADANDDGRMDISDPTSILAFLFLGGAEPRAPGPRACGEDSTADGLLRCDYSEMRCR